MKGLSCIIDSTDDAIYSKDLEGTILTWNAGAERMFGWPAEEMIGNSVNTIIPPELHGQEERILFQLRHGIKVNHFETQRWRKDGERIHVSLTISPITDELGEVVGAASITRDITKQKRAEEALRTNERLASVGRLAATVSHEINNPLEAVTNLVWLAENHPATPGEVRQWLSIAAEELKRVAAITKQTLGFYRDRKEPHQIRVSEVVENVVGVYHRKLENKRIHLTLTADEIMEVMAVRGEVRQLFSNLLTNAIDAVGLGGNIKVRVSTATSSKTGESGVRITILDDGSGITSNIRKHIFEPFYTTKKDYGTGLGLWVCKGIVDSLHGDIQVRSNGKSWTAVSIFLPGVPEMALEQVA